MKYEHVISGAPKNMGRKQQEPVTNLKSERTGPTPAARRFPPVLQILTRTADYIEKQLSAIAMQAFKQGKTIEHICSDLYHYAQTLGFTATIGVQEVYSSNMPSFPGQTVISALLMVDLKPIGMPGASYSRPAGYAS